MAHGSGTTWVRWDEDCLSDQNLMTFLFAFAGEISAWIASGETHEVISVSLQRRYPHDCGFSARNIRRFCSIHNIHYHSRLGDLPLDRLGLSQVWAVGHSYGKRTLHGLLSSHGIHVSQRRLGESLSRVAPGPHTVTWILPCILLDILGTSYIKTRMRSCQCTVWCMWWLWMGIAVNRRYDNYSSQKPNNHI